jgi:hypothetical protein
MDHTRANRARWPCTDSLVSTAVASSASEAPVAPATVPRDEDCDLVSFDGATTDL